MKENDFFLWIQGVIDTHPHGLTPQAVAEIKKHVDDIVAAKATSKLLEDETLKISMAEWNRRMLGVQTLTYPGMIASATTTAGLVWGDVATNNP